MKRAIEILKQLRHKILAEISNLSVEQLNKIPDGFNNNIIWNLGHMIASQQGLCYLRAGLPTSVDEAFFNRYKSGTKPEAYLDAAGVEELKKMLFSTLEQLGADYDNGIFSNYTSVVTRYDVEVNSVDEAIAFLPFHDGLHIGYIMSLRKLV